MLHTCLTWICCQFEKSIWHRNWFGEFFFFGSNLVNYKYITCSLLCSLYTCWMCLIQIRQKYFRCSSVRKHNFGFILCFVLSTFYLLFFFVFFLGRGGGVLTFYLLLIDDFWNSVVGMQSIGKKGKVGIACLPLDEKWWGSFVW